MISIRLSDSFHYFLDLQNKNSQHFWPWTSQTLIGSRSQIHWMKEAAWKSQGVTLSAFVQYATTECSKKRRDVPKNFIEKRNIWRSPSEDTGGALLTTLFNTESSIKIHKTRNRDENRKYSPSPLHHPIMTHPFLKQQYFLFIRHWSFASWSFNGWTDRGSVRSAARIVYQKRSPRKERMKECM